MDTTDKDLRLKKKVMPVLEEIQNRREKLKPLEQAVLSNLNGADFEDWGDLGTSLSYLLCISKTILNENVNSVKKVLANDFIIESMSDVSDVMTDVIHIATQLARKNLINSLNIENTIENQKFIDSLLLGLEDELDVNSIRKILLPII